VLSGRRKSQREAVAQKWWWSVLVSLAFPRNAIGRHAISRLMVYVIYVSVNPSTSIVDQDP
jgi:hypothetical protein